MKKPHQPKKTTQTPFLFIIILTSTLLHTTLTECTPDSCLYCMNDGSSKYCTACGNGLLLVGNGTNTRCAGEIPVPHCYQSDPKNPNICLQCRRGFYLTKDLRCRKLKIFHCMTGTEINGKIYCSLCDGRNLRPDYKKCISGDLPPNCMSGNVNGFGCLLCEPGYSPDSFTRKCKKNELTGCGIYDNKNNCIECDTFHGYYAVDSTNRNGRVFQIECKFRSGGLWLWALGLIFLGVLGN